jgi:DNA repair protein RecN (Recombination protein N)
VAARGLCGLLPEAEEIAKRIEGIYVDLKDIARDVDVLMGRIELRPDRLREVMDRLDVIYSLERRFGVGSVGELLVICDCLRREIGEIDGADGVLAGLEGELAVALGEMERLGGLLTGVRMGAAVLFEGRLREVVGELGMPSMCFSVDFSRRLMPDVTGFDVVRFMFSGGGGGVLKPVDETASGGEVSRLMLGVKFVIAGVTALPTIVFDEIDMGVSGEMADRMGRILREMGGWMQVIAISHLPQIAAKGVWHYIVFKSDRGGMAETGIRLLLDDERVMVIAKMLSGECLSDAAVDNARALMVV